MFIKCSIMEVLCRCCSVHWAFEAMQSVCPIWELHWSHAVSVPHVRTFLKPCVQRAPCESFLEAMQSVCPMGELPWSGAVSVPHVRASLKPCGQCVLCESFLEAMQSVCPVWELPPACSGWVGALRLPPGGGETGGTVGRLLGWTEAAWCCHQPLHWSWVCALSCYMYIDICAHISLLLFCNMW